MTSLELGARAAGGHPGPDPGLVVVEVAQKRVKRARKAALSDDEGVSVDELDLIGAK